MRRRIVAAVIVAAGLATAGIAYAENQPADPSVASNPPAAAKAGGRAAAPGVLKGAIHGDLLVRGEEGGATRTVTFDRGKITAISATSITIERPDGVSVSKNLTDQTVFNGTPKDQLKAGTGVIVVSSGDTANRVISKGHKAQKGQEQRQEKRQDRLERRKDRLEQRQERLKPSSTLDDGLETIPA
jgi:hypothetical protein